jgi:surface-anchored protein
MNLPSSLSNTRFDGEVRHRGCRRFYLSRRQPRTSGMLWALAVLLPLCASAAEFGILTREHVDGPFVRFQAGANPELSLVVRDETARVDYAGTNVILVARAEARLTLPAGTPFGAAGAPLWILPQTQNPNLLYLGISAADVPHGAFSGPLNLRVTRYEGPGYFMVWQATGPGQFNFRIDTRDGLSSDGFSPSAGAHEHFNWGFSTTGVHCVTYQVSGTRAGSGALVMSPEMTVAFHVLPLPPATNFATWQKHFWPPGFRPERTVTNANPDADAFSNLHEYAFGLSPTNANALTNGPHLLFVATNGQSFGALTFTRNNAARDLRRDAEVTAEVPGGWVALTNAHASQTLSNEIERVTLRDFVPVTNGARRFYRVQPQLLP